MEIPRHAVLPMCVCVYNLCEKSIDSLQVFAYIKLILFDTVRDRLLRLRNLEGYKFLTVKSIIYCRRYTSFSNKFK